MPTVVVPFEYGFSLTRSGRIAPQLEEPMSYPAPPPQRYEPPPDTDPRSTKLSRGGYTKMDMASINNPDFTGQPYSQYKLNGKAPVKTWKQVNGGKKKPSIPKSSTPASKRKVNASSKSGTRRNKRLKIYEDSEDEAGISNAKMLLVKEDESEIEIENDEEYDNDDDDHDHQDYDKMDLDEGVGRTSAESTGRRRSARIASIEYSK